MKILCQLGKHQWVAQGTVPFSCGCVRCAEERVYTDGRWTTR